MDYFKLNNKTFRTNLQPQKPHYFIHCYLDVAKILPTTANTNFSFMLYFNKENNLNYLSYPTDIIDTYPHYWTFTKNTGVIQDVAIYTLPTINQSNSLLNDSFTSIKAGLVSAPSSNNLVLTDQWTGLTGNITTNITRNIINTISQVQLDYVSQRMTLGRGPQISNINNKYLGLFIEGFTSSLEQAQRDSIVIHLIVKIYSKYT